MITMSKDCLHLAVAASRQDVSVRLTGRCAETTFRWKRCWWPLCLPLAPEGEFVQHTPRSFGEPAQPSGCAASHGHAQPPLFAQRASRAGAVFLQSVAEGSLFSDKVPEAFRAVCRRHSGGPFYKIGFRLQTDL
jgi:hypothetical protein